MADNKLYTKERLFLCLDVPEKAQERFKHIKGLSDDLHVTLVYVPDKTISEEDQTKVLDAIAKVAKDYKDLECEFTGIGNFDNGDDTMVALVNIPDGSSLYVALVDAIEGVVGEWEKKYGFIPHCTLKEKGDGESDLEDLKDFKWTAKDIRVTFGDDNISYVALGSGKIEKKSSLTFGSILETPELLNPYPFKAGDTVTMCSSTSHRVYESTILYIGLVGDMPDFRVEQYQCYENEALRLPKDTVVIKYKFNHNEHVWWETLSTFVYYWQSPTVIDKTSSILKSIPQEIVVYNIYEALREFKPFQMWRDNSKNLQYLVLGDTYHGKIKNSDTRGVEKLCVYDTEWFYKESKIDFISSPSFSYDLSNDSDFPMTLVSEDWRLLERTSSILKIPELTCSSELSIASQNISFTKESSILNSILKPIKGSSAYAFICDKVMNVNAYGRKALGLHPDGVNLDSIVSGLNYVYNAKESNNQEYAINCYIPNITNDLLMTLILDKSEFDKGFVKSKEASQLDLEFGGKKASILESVPPPYIITLKEFIHEVKPFQLWQCSRIIGTSNSTYLAIGERIVVTRHIKQHASLDTKVCTVIGAEWLFSINKLVGRINIIDKVDIYEGEFPLNLISDDWRTLRHTASILESVPQEDVANSLDELEQYAKPYQIWRETSKNKHSYLYIADPQIVYKSDINIIFKLAIWHYRITNGNFLLSSISENICNAWQRSAPFTLVCDDWRTLPEERVERNASILEDSQFKQPFHEGDTLNINNGLHVYIDYVGRAYDVPKNLYTDNHDSYVGDSIIEAVSTAGQTEVVVFHNLPTFMGYYWQTLEEFVTNVSFKIIKQSSILDAPELQEANQEYMPGDVYRERVGYINTQYDDNLHYNDLETVEDAIRYEIEALDNVEIANEMKQALRTMGLNDQRIPSNRLLWVWKDSNHAGVMSLDESEVNIEQVKIPVGSRVMSDCGGDILLLVPANTRQGNKNRPHPVAVPIRQQLDYPHFTFDKQSSILTAIKDREYYEPYLDKIDESAPEFKVPEEYTGIKEEDTEPQSPQEDIGAYNSIVDAVESEGNTDPDVLNEELQAAYERRLKGWELYKIHQTYIREAEENKGYDVWRLVEDYADAKGWSIYENDDSGDYANFLVMKQFADKVSYYKVSGYETRKSIDDWEWETTQNTTIKDWSLDENYWDYEDLFKDENVNKELANQYEDPQDPYRSNPLAYVYEHLSYYGGNNDYTISTCYDVFTRVLNGMFLDDEKLEPFDPKMFVPPSNFPTYKQPADPNQLDLYTGKTEKELFPHRYRFESSLNFEAIQKHGSILDDPQFDEFREPEPPEPEPEPEVAWIPLKEAYHEMEVGESWEVKRGDSTAKIWLIREKHLEIVEGGVDKFTFHLIINGQRFIYRTPKANEELYIARQIMQHPAAQLEQGIINFSDWSAYLEGKTYDVNTFWQYAKRGQIWSFIRKGAGQFDGYTVRRYVLITKLEPSKDYVHGYYCYQVAECMERNEITTGSPIEDEWTSIKYETYVNQNG